MRNLCSRTWKTQFKVLPDLIKPGTKSGNNTVEIEHHYFPWVIPVSGTEPSLKKIWRRQICVLRPRKHKIRPFSEVPTSQKSSDSNRKLCMRTDFFFDPNFAIKITFLDWKASVKLNFGKEIFLLNQKNIFEDYFGSKIFLGAYIIFKFISLSFIFFWALDPIL